MSDKPTILHVDDDPILRRALRRLFERSGWTYVEAEHGEEGLRRAEHEQPAVILLDIRMPIVDGFEVLRMLKAKQETKDIPVIMCSGLGAKEDIRFCLDGGACGYLVKTHHHPEEIHAHVLRLLQGGEAGYTE